MDLQRCLKILELETTGSIEDAKRVYKDLVRVWHPDRFQNNPRLKYKAEQRLREINLAYKFLCRHIESNQAGELSASYNTPVLASSKGNLTNQSNQTGTRRYDANAPEMAHASQQGSGSFSVPITKAVPRRSFLGRFVLLAFVFVFLAISALVVYFIHNTDEIASRTRGVASEAMDKIIEHLEQNQPAEEYQAPVKPLVEDLDRPVKPNKPRPKFEIHLDSGSIIMTEDWWEEGDMIMYRVEGGSMGIERTRVKKIVNR